jgi:hypothetical protein
VLLIVILLTAALLLCGAHNYGLRGQRKDLRKELRTAWADHEAEVAQLRAHVECARGKARAAAGRSLELQDKLREQDDDLQRVRAHNARLAKRRDELTYLLDQAEKLGEHRLQMLDGVHRALGIPSREKPADLQEMLETAMEETYGAGILRAEFDWNGVGVSTAAQGPASGTNLPPLGLQDVHVSDDLEAGLEARAEAAEAEYKSSCEASTAAIKASRQTPTHSE